MKSNGETLSILLNNPDRFGYYTVGDHKTYSKLDAIELHIQTGIHPTWHFNDEIFGSCDWINEPTESLDELYRIRAQQIREKYDYVVLFYSSGADSQNMLNAFIRNGIHIDEIVNFWAKEGDDDYDSFFNAEIYHEAIPNTLKIVAEHPAIKHRVIDLTSIIAGLYNDSDRRFDFLYDMNCMFSPNNYARSFIRESISEYKDITASGKNMCFVYGSEKPRLYLEAGKYCVRFLDILDNVVTPRTQRLNRSWEHDELFYWSPDLPELIIKQAHVVMRYLKVATASSSGLSTNPSYGSFGTKLVNGLPHYITNHGVHRLLYNIVNPNTYKPPSIIFSDRDAWFLKNPSHSTSAANYLSGIQKLGTVLPAYWVNGVFDRGIKGCVSQPYWIES